MKEVTVKNIEKMLTRELELLRKELSLAASESNYKDALELQTKVEFIQWLLEEVFTGHIWMTPSQILKKAKKYV